MNTEPVAVPAIGVPASPLRVRLAWQRRIVFAVVVVVGSVVAFAVDEVPRWQRTIDLGLRVSPGHDCIVSVTPGGLAERAGVKPVILVFMDDLGGHWRKDAYVVEIDGSVHVRKDVRQLRTRLRPFANEDSACEDYWPLFEGSSAGDDVVIAIEGPTSWARDPQPPWHSLFAVPFIVLFAVLTATLASRTPWRRGDVERWRLHSFVVPAIATTLLVPWWMHLSVLTLLHLSRDGERYLFVVASTVPAWIALVVIAAKHAARHARGDFTTSSWRWMTVPILPAALLVVPGIVVMITAAILLLVLRRHDRRALERETFLP